MKPLQAAVSLVLLVGAGLLTRSLNKLEHQDFGVQTQDRVVVHINPQNAGFKPDQLQALYDELQQRFGSLPGVERVGLSLGVVDENINVGDVLTLVWGEENGGTKKVTVERHKQVEVRVKVSVTPYGSVARETYHQGWRNRTT